MSHYRLTPSPLSDFYYVFRLGPLKGPSYSSRCGEKGCFVGHLSSSKFLLFLLLINSETFDGVSVCLLNFLYIYKSSLVDLGSFLSYSDTITSVLDEGGVRGTFEGESFRDEVHETGSVVSVLLLPRETGFMDCPDVKLGSFPSVTVKIG